MADRSIKLQHDSKESVIKQAFDSHKSGKNADAILLYLKCIEKGWATENIILNVSSLLRADNQKEKAINIIKSAISKKMVNASIYNNLGNIYSDMGRNVEANAAFIKALRLDVRQNNARVLLIRSLNQKKLFSLGSLLLKDLVRHRESTPDEKLDIATMVVDLFQELSTDDEGKNKIIKLINSLNIHKDNYTIKQKFILAKIKTDILIQEKDEDSLLEELRELESLFHQMTKNEKTNYEFILNATLWNNSNKLLKMGNIKEGWRYYNFGLRVPAKGNQKWQRAMVKIYPYTTLPILRDLKTALNKNLLLLGEQGIGDSMMFMQLINHIPSQIKLTIALNGRIAKTYKDAFPQHNILIDNEIKKLYPNPANYFDYQLPLGSLPNLINMKLDNLKQPGKLIRSKERTKSLRQKYFSEGGSLDKKYILGISWQGGGRIDRIPAKSIGLEMLLPIINNPNIVTLSLQYGDDKPHIDRFNLKYNVNILHDNDINPLVSIEDHLDQVAAVDFVISIANTTIHAAGGLNIPTLCLVSKKSDWRWINPSIYQGCYWYHSVDACYQENDGSWSNAIKNSTIWLNKQIVLSEKRS